MSERGASTRYSIYIPLATLHSTIHGSKRFAQCTISRTALANMDPLTLLTPLTREGYENLIFWWQFFPIVCLPCNRSLHLPLINNFIGHSLPVGLGYLPRW